MQDRLNNVGSHGLCPPSDQSNVLAHHTQHSKTSQRQNTRSDKKRAFQSREKKGSTAFKRSLRSNTKSRRKVFRPSPFKGKKETFFTDLECPAQARAHTQNTRRCRNISAVSNGAASGAQSSGFGVTVLPFFHDESTRRSGGGGQETAASVAAVRTYIFSNALQKRQLSL